MGDGGFFCGVGQWVHWMFFRWDEWGCKIHMRKRSHKLGPNLKFWVQP